MKISFIHKFFTAVLVSSSLLANPVIAKGIPTIDLAGLAKAKEQIDNQLKQIAQLKAQLDALRSKNNWGHVARDAADTNLPDEWKSLYNSVDKASKNKDLLSSKGYNANADSEQLVQHLKILNRAAEDAQRGVKRIDELFNQLNKTQDIKSSQDLQNRIAAEPAKIQQNQTALDNMERMMRLQEKIQSRKRAAYLNCRRDNVVNRTNKSCS